MEEILGMEEEQSVSLVAQQWLQTYQLQEMGHGLPQPHCLQEPILSSMLHPCPMATLLPPPLPTLSPLGTQLGHLSATKTARLMHPVEGPTMAVSSIWMLVLPMKMPGGNQCVL